ncbi:hypothetical protein P8A18_02445 [Streptomyces castrisilvae]|uniref:Uncharacterized protein n=1 Tax=Streptomyces castrisilvae TaxID=3033811 RepID=A0ABY9HCY4_9ACTN|nr:hypothetical protein [Streptomyces sp. Mut1]WLQ32375.1 hypothetical protein P8A18_02445 [Streptomyces sp. Mut1]
MAAGFGVPSGLDVGDRKRETTAGTSPELVITIVLQDQSKEMLIIGGADGSQLSWRVWEPRHRIMRQG